MKEYTYFLENESNAFVIADKVLMFSVNINFLTLIAFKNGDYQGKKKVF